MKMIETRQIKRYEMLLAAVIIARATSLLIVKGCLSGFSIFNLMTLRFALAFICIIPFVSKRITGIQTRTLLRGALLGAIFFSVIAVELLGLKLTASASVVSFLENTSIMIVPVAAAFLERRRLQIKVAVSAVIAMCGVGFLLMNDGQIELTAGIAICLLTAVLYSAYVIVTDRVAKQDDPLVLGTIQLGVVAVLSGAASVLTETPRLPQDSTEWTGLILLAVICGSIGSALQPVAQSRVDADKAGLFCALYPLTACTLGWLLLGEWQGVSGLIGAALIVAAILISAMKTPEKYRGIELKRLDLMHKKWFTIDV